MSEFSDRPLYAGTVTGLRAFDVDSLGRLVGPQKRTVFTPGENGAECLLNPIQSTLRALERQLARASQPPQVTLNGVPWTPAPTFAAGGPVTPSDHKLAGLDCTCGFYAYFDGSNDYHHAGITVQAIVEGYGTVTIGTRGFRSEKAALTALVLPAKPKGWQIRPGRYVSRLTLFWIVWCTAFVAFDMWQRAWIAASIFGVLLGVNIFLAWLELHRHHDTSRADLVRRNYPDVPTYPTLAKALKAHPLTPPVEVTPETCDDFWVRRAGA